MFNAAQLINLLGFTVGIALYALLLLMVVRHRDKRRQDGFDFLLLLTATLGLLWNAGELTALFWRDFSMVNVSPLLLAISYSALGFLPSVVVHSAWKNDENGNPRIGWLTYAAYALSFFAAVLHIVAAFTEGAAPSDTALRALTIGSLLLLAGLLAFTIRQKLEKKTIWIAALSVFAVSALHLSGEQEEKSWLVELVAHQSSLPLALAILLQDFRFAFADLFLKRALSLLLLAAVAFGGYVFVAVPLLAWHETHDRNDVQAAVVVIALWMATALVYPVLHKFAVWLVDSVILKRVGYQKLEAKIVRSIEKIEDPRIVLDDVGERLRFALTARTADWSEVPPDENIADKTLVTRDASRAEILVPTVEAPVYRITLDDFAGGRRLLSGDMEMLATIAVATARRIDALRVSEERYERKNREDRLAKHAAEARLSALRAQINPHFLFNALTTIGYLIQTTPDKAFQTLMKLTQLLRGVLKTTEEFTSLGDELKLIENYLDIEKTRFEERLRVEVRVPPSLRKLRVPALILQPIVENAVKHGISEAKKGGDVIIAADVKIEDGESFLYLAVEDTGAGFNENKPTSGGIGLENVRQRLRAHYGRAAALTIESVKNKGTRAELKMPVRIQTV